ncbi:hypothetical protein MHYP_G00090750 [Metynnis hypsauchen]
MKYRRYLVEEKDVRRTAQHRWRRTAGVWGSDCDWMGLKTEFVEDLMHFTATAPRCCSVRGGPGSEQASQDGGVLGETKTSDESEDDCDPSVTDRPVRMSCQIFAGVDESKDDLDLSDRPELSTLQTWWHMQSCCVSIFGNRLWAQKAPEIKVLKKREVAESRNVPRTSARTR